MSTQPTYTKSIQTRTHLNSSPGLMPDSLKRMNLNYGTTGYGKSVANRRPSVWCKDMTNLPKDLATIDIRGLSANWIVESLAMEVR